MNRLSAGQAITRAITAITQGGITLGPPSYKGGQVIAPGNLAFQHSSSATTTAADGSREAVD
jgi:hypothetical protein